MCDYFKEYSTLAHRYLDNKYWGCTNSKINSWFLVFRMFKTQLFIKIKQAVILESGFRLKWVVSLCIFPSMLEYLVCMFSTDF